MTKELDSGLSLEEAAWVMFILVAAYVEGRDTLLEAKEKGGAQE